MGSIDLKPKGGRKPKMALVDGEYVMIKKLSRFKTSQALFLPREWLLAVSAKYDKDVTEVAIDYNSTVLTIRPYFGNEEGNPQ